MNALWLLMALLSAPSRAEILYWDPDEGSYIVRDAALAEAFHDSDRWCDAHQDALRRLRACALPRRASQKREQEFWKRRAAETLGECLSGDRRARRRLAAVIGTPAVETMLKAEAFEDTVYVQTEPTAPAAPTVAIR